MTRHMAGEKTLNLIDITRIGAEVLLEALNRHPAPLAYARMPSDSRDPAPPVFLNRPAFAAVFAAARPADDMICAVQDCFLLGPFGAVVLPTGQILRQSLINLDGDALQYSLAQFTGQFPGAQIPWTTAEQTVFAVNSYATNNYFHFMIDSLANLHWQERAAGFAHAPCIVSGYPPAAEATLPFIPSAYDAAGLAHRQAFDGTLLFCRSLIFPRRVTGADPARVAWLRKRFGVTGARGSRKIYLARGDAQRRRLTNEAALIGRLEQRGFTAVMTGELSVRDQAQLFAQAAVVVGPHGAGLTNAAFMAPGGAMIELTHTGRVVATYHELANAADLTYGCVVGDMAGDSGQPILADFNVDIDAVEAAVAAASAG